MVHELLLGGTSDMKKYGEIHARAAWAHARSTVRPPLRAATTEMFFLGAWTRLGVRCKSGYEKETETRESHKKVRQPGGYCAAREGKRYEGRANETVEADENTTKSVAKAQETVNQRDSRFGGCFSNDFISSLPRCHAAVIRKRAALT